jgi:hypothetical protein
MKKLKKLFVPCSQSRQLKELGFDEPCFGIFIDGNFNLIFTDRQVSDKVISAPTFSQAFKFIREKYNLIGLVEGGYDNGKNIFTYVIWEGFKDIITDDYFETPEEAELNCLNELIKMLKENGK